jgi:type II secretory pathway pseudopilin PulG
MNPKFRHKGFSLTEVLLAVGTLAIGMSFVGGTFLVGVYLSTVATERTIAATAAEEAFTKIELYGLDPASSLLAGNQQVRFSALNPIPTAEFAYPSSKEPVDKQYYWSALCRSMYPDAVNRLVQVTVFVSRKIGNSTFPEGVDIPVPVQVAVSKLAGAGNQNKLTITSSAQQSFINAGSTIEANKTGRLYRVLQRDAVTQNTITLDIPWQEEAVDSVWAVPPPIKGGKNPCIAIYQKEIRF